MHLTKKLLTILISLSLFNQSHTAIPAAATPIQDPEELRYGDKIVLMHKTTGLCLNGIKAPQGQPSVVCSNIKSTTSYWMIKGPHKSNAPTNCVFGDIVKPGDRIRLEGQDGKNLSSSGSNASSSQKKTARLNGTGGVGDDSDTWIIKQDPDEQEPTISVGDRIKITQGTETLWPSTTPRPDGSRELFCSSNETDDGWWTVDTSFEAYTLAPAGFEREAGLTTSIGCGCKTTGSDSATLEVWCLSENRLSLHRYNPSIMTTNPWEDVIPVDEKKAPLGLLNDLSVASDGTLGIIRADETVWIYNWNNKYFTQLPTQDPTVKIDALSIGNNLDIFGLNKTTHTLYKHDGKTWVVINNGGVEDIAAGLDGTVVILSTDGAPQLYKGQQYEALGSIKLENIAVGNIDTIIGSTENGELMRYDHIKNRWNPFLGANRDSAIGIKEVSINAGGCMFLTDRSGGIWSNEESVYILTNSRVASAQENAGNTNIKIVTGTTKKLSGSLRFQARKEGKIKIAPPSEDATKKLIQLPKRRKVRKIRRIRRIGIIKPATGPQKHAAPTTQPAGKPSVSTPAHQTTAAPTGQPQPGQKRAGKRANKRAEGGH